MVDAIRLMPTMRLSQCGLVNNHSYRVVSGLCQGCVKVMLRLCQGCVIAGNGKIHSVCWVLIVLRVHHSVLYFTPWYDCSLLGIHSMYDNNM